MDWEKAVGVYWHLSARDGDWTADRALWECWSAACRYALEAAAKSVEGLEPIDRLLSADDYASAIRALKVKS